MRAFVVGAFIVGLLGFVDAVGAFERWERIGSRTVEFRQDQDTIYIGPREGRFRAIMLEVTGGTLEMDNVRLVFGNGAPFYPQTRLEFNEGSRSRVIDLPGDARFIETISFNYSSLRPDQGRAVVTVYGRP